MEMSLISRIVFPSRSDFIRRSALRSSAGAFWARAVSALDILAFCFVPRAFGARLSHSTSRLRKFCVLRQGGPNLPKPPRVAARV